MSSREIATNIYTIEKIKPVAIQTQEELIAFAQSKRVHDKYKRAKYQNS